MPLSLIVLTVALINIPTRILPPTPPCSPIATWQDLGMAMRMTWPSWRVVETDRALCPHDIVNPLMIEAYRLAAGRREAGPPVMEDPARGTSAP